MQDVSSQIGAVTLQDVVFKVVTSTVFASVGLLEQQCPQYLKDRPDRLTVSFYLIGELVFYLLIDDSCMQTVVPHPLKMPWGLVL